MNKDLKVEVITAPEVIANTNLEKAIYDLDNEIENLTVRADKLDYFISICYYNTKQKNLQQEVIT